MNAPRRLRVCINAAFLQNDHIGGIGNYAKQIALRLVARHPDWEITLLTHVLTAHNFADIPGLRVRVMPAKSLALRFLYFHLLFPFLSGRYDLVHSVGNLGMLFARARQVITIHDSYEHLSPERFSRFKRALQKFIIAWSGRRAKRILTVSENSARTIRAFYPYLAPKLSVIYSGSKFPVRPAADAENRDGFLFVGTIEPGKNLSLALRAFAEFRRKRKGLLRIVGAEGWKQSHLSGLIESLGITDSVLFLGYVSDRELAGLYEHALALIQPSNFEGFGLPVIEAMACGCPVLAARNSGLIEAGGDAALFFPTHDVDALAGLLVRIDEDPALRAHCVAAGLKHAHRFSWENTVSQVEAEYIAALEA